jgi:hypothetical protein
MRSLSKNRPQQLMFSSKVWPMRGCFAIQHRLEEAASPSDREIDANQKHVMSNHDKNFLIEQLYVILRGGVKEPLAVESTQDKAIENARKLEPDAAIQFWSRTMLSPNRPDR